MQCARDIRRIRIMIIKDFVDAYLNETDENNRNELIKKHIKRTYISYISKYTVASRIVDDVCYDNGVFANDTPRLIFTFVISVIKMYTDLEVDKDDPINDFDLLEQNSLTIKITNAIGDDYNTFETILYSVVEDREKKESSIISYLKNLEQDINKYIASDDFKNLISNAVNGAKS
jgi:hypothetical protein